MGSILLRRINVPSEHGGKLRDWEDQRKIVTKSYGDDYTRSIEK